MLGFITSLLLTAAPLPAVPLSRCTVRPYVAGPPSAMGQYQIRVEYPAGCGAGRLFVRIRTRLGGLIIPPIGYFPLSAGYPREIRYWVWPGARVEQKNGNAWQERPIRDTPPGWY